MMTEPINQEHPITGLPGKLTAREAVAVVEPVVQRYDIDRRLIAVTSDYTIDDEGRAAIWVFVYLLPHARARARFEVHYRNYHQYREPPLHALIERITPVYPPGNVVEQVLQLGRVPDALVGSIPGNALAELLASGELTPDWPAQQWQATIKDHVALPIPFRDSPEAVQALSELGADFAGSGHDLCLETIILATGEIMWRVLDDDDYQTPFT